MRTEKAVELFLRDCRYRGLVDRTLVSYGWALAKLEARFEELPTKPDDLMYLIVDQDLSQESKHDMWRVLRRIYKWLASRKYAKNAMKDVPPPRRRRRLPRTLESTEIDRLMSTIDSRRDLAMIALILDTGIRVGELATLKWIDVHAGTIHVDGKTGERRVPVSPQVLQFMVGLGDGEHIWIGRYGPLTVGGCSLIIRRALAGAGIRGRKSGPHMLRHSFGRHYVMAGGDVFSLQRILGHRDVGTTMIYVHLSAADLEVQHAKYSPLRAISLVSSTPKEEAKL